MRSCYASFGASEVRVGGLMVGLEAEEKIRTTHLYCEFWGQLLELRMSSWSWGMMRADAGGAYAHA